MSLSAWNNSAWNRSVEVSSPPAGERFDPVVRDPPLPKAADRFLLADDEDGDKEGEEKEEEPFMLLEDVFGALLE